MESLADWLRELYTDTGINFIHFYDDYERARFLRGMWFTIKLSAVSILASIVIGIIGAWAQTSGSRFIRGFTQGYIQFFRNTPPLVQMYFFYFALGPLLPRVATEYGTLQPMLSSFTWAAISLSFFAGAFNVEIFRAGIEAVPRTMTEAAGALGYRPLQIYRYVVFPLGIRIVIPALTNNIVNLLKTTTLAYAIAVPEALFMASQIWSDRVNVMEMMLTLFVFYIGLVGILVLVMDRWEKSLRIPGYGQ
jgi:polar amino acid transport system permease protein